MAARKTRVGIAFGTCIVRARRHLGLTQEALAEKARCSVVYVSNIENGLYQPTLTKLMDLEAALAMEPGELTRRTATLVRQSARKRR